MTQNKNSIRILTGEGDLQYVQLTNNNGASVQIYLLGATVTSYKTEKGEDVIFQSSKAIFKDGKAIRGGIPICFPQFGPGTLPQHGFARNRLWQLKSTSATFNVVQAIFTLKDDEELRKLWNNRFEVEYLVSLHPKSLITELSVINKNSSETFTFTACLHTYFRIGSIHQTQVSPFKGLQFIDKVQGGKQFTSEENEVTFKGETDRIYLKASPSIKIEDKSANIQYQIETKGFTDCVVWNPWEIKAKETVDLGLDEWKNFVCAEAGTIGTPVLLKPGESWKSSQTISKL